MGTPWNMHNVFSNNWKDLAVMVFPKVMPPVLHCWYMCLAGSNVITRMYLPAAILNSMPMGFYQPAQIVIDARKHGVEVRPVDINYSDWDNKLEEKAGKYCALRLGFRQVKGLREDDIKILIAARKKSYNSINELRDSWSFRSCIGKIGRCRCIPIDWS